MAAVRDPKQAITFAPHPLALGLVLKSRAVPTHAPVNVVNADEQKNLTEWVQITKDPRRQQLARQLKELRQARKRFAYLIAELEGLLSR